MPKKRTRRGLGAALAPSHKFQPWAEDNWKESCRVVAQRDKKIGRGFGGKGAYDAIRLAGKELIRHPDRTSAVLWKLEGLRKQAAKIVGGPAETGLQAHLESMRSCIKHGLAYGQAPKRK